METSQLARPARVARAGGPLLVLSLLVASAHPQAPDQAAPAVDPEVTRADLEQAVRWLAADERRGRSTGSEEAVEAARWLAARLEAAGVAPAGDEGGYLQRVPLAQLEYEAVPQLTIETATGETPAPVYGVDFDFVAGVCADASLEVRVVRTAEDLPPEPAAGIALWIDPRGREQRGLRELAGTGWGLVLLRGSTRAGRRAKLEPPRAQRLEGADTGQARMMVRGPLAERFGAGEVARVRAGLVGRRVEQPAFNVVGTLAGAGTSQRPELADEALVFSAHYDHIGVRADASEGEDAIYNGADDDASGCATVLELGEAFGAGPPPARTLVFLLATGEEIGLVGTEYYLDHPAVPLERTVCNLNFEMVGRPDALAGGPGRLWLTGDERSNLAEAFERAGLAVVGDPRPEQRFFQRSDNYAFARRGIVAQTLSSYDLHADYHRVTDEADKLDYAHMEAASRAALAAARAIADGALDPAWLPGGSPAR